MQLVVDRHCSTTDLHVLLSPSTMSALGVTDGGIVKIAARRFILASVSSRDLGGNDQRIFIPRIFRVALKCALGETVTVSAFTMCKPADQVILAPVSETCEHIKGDFMSLIRESGYDFTNIPLWKDMIIPVCACQHLFEFRVVSAAPISAVVVQNPNVIVCESVHVERGNAPGYEGVSYDDVGGIDDQLLLIRRHVESLRTVSVLITAPSGCGKTYLSRAICNETSAHFEYLPCMELLSMPFERASSALGKIYENIKQKKPAVVYLDDLDSVTNGNLFHEGRRDDRLNQTVGEFIDRLSQLESVVVFATAKGTEDLGYEFTPPRRFHEEIKLGIPGTKQRTQVLKVMTRRMPISSANAFDDITVMTEGKTPSDLLWICEKSLVNQLRNLVMAYDNSSRRVDLNQLREIAIGQGQFDRKKMKKNDTKQKRKAKKGKKKNLDVFDDILKEDEDEDGESPRENDKLFTMGGGKQFEEHEELFGDSNPFAVKENRSGQFKKKSKRHRKHDVTNPFGKSKPVDPFGSVPESSFGGEDKKQEELDDRMSDPFATGRGLNFGMKGTSNDPFSTAPPKSMTDDDSDPFAMSIRKAGEREDVFGRSTKTQVDESDPFASVNKPANGDGFLSSKKSAIEEDIFAPSPPTKNPDLKDPFAPKPQISVQTSSSFSGKVLGKSLRDAIRQSPKPTENDDPFAMAPATEQKFTGSHSSSAKSTGDPFGASNTTPRPTPDDDPFSVTPKSATKTGTDVMFAPSPKPMNESSDPFAPDNDPFARKGSASSIDGPFSVPPKSSSGDPFAPEQRQVSCDPFSPSFTGGGLFSATPKESSGDDPFAAAKETPKHVDGPFASTPKDSTDPFAIRRQVSEDRFVAPRDVLGGDPFAAKPLDDPFASTPKDTTKRVQDPFATTPKETSNDDPFAITPKETPKQNDDPFSAKGFSKQSDDPFAVTPKETPKQNEDPFAVTPKQSGDPFAVTPKETPKQSGDPFAATPKHNDDPFAVTPKETPKQNEDPFGVPTQNFSKQSNDPFAATPKETPGQNEDPFAPASNDSCAKATDGTAVSGDLAPEAPKPPSDPFALAPGDPFAPTTTVISSDPFAAPPKESPQGPFGAAPTKPSNDPFALPPPKSSNDPFAAALPKSSGDPFATAPSKSSNDPFAAAPSKEAPKDPFAAPPRSSGDPFAAAPSKSSNDPFAATLPKSSNDPFAAAPPKEAPKDPFAAPPKSSNDPFAPAPPKSSGDAFAAPPKEAPKDPFAAPPTKLPNDPFSSPPRDTPEKDPFAPSKPAGEDIFSSFQSPTTKTDPFAARPAGSPPAAPATGNTPFASVMKLRIDDDIFGPSKPATGGARRNPRESLDPFAVPPKP